MSGSVSGTYKGYKGYYNFYNIGANDSAGGGAIAMDLDMLRTEPVMRKPIKDI